MALAMVGIIAFTKGLDLGKGAHIQAIYNLQSPIQVLLTFLFHGVVPVPLEWVGCLLGLVGVTFIILQKKE